MIEIVLPFPPSTNTYYRHLSGGSAAGRSLISAAGRKYRQAIQEQALVQRWKRFKPEERLAVEIDAWMPDRRRRDLDNMLKSTLDSLTHAGLWSDDSQIDSLKIVRIPTLGGMLKIRVKALEATCS